MSLPTGVFEAKHGKVWMVNGVLHRTNGPAIERTDGTCEWVVFGKYCSFDEWCDRVDVDEKTRTFLRLKYA